MFAPVITIVLFAIIAMANGTTLDTKTAFPTIAVLALVTHSANMVMTIAPQAIAAYASFDRIEDYIKSIKAVSRSPRPGQLAEGIEVSIRGLTVKWTPKQSNPTLEDVNLELPRGKVVACLGPVGSGKTSLARAILGEVPLGKGTVTYATDRIAYCSQVPWLPNRTMKQVIRGSMTIYGDIDHHWYLAVVRACCLDQDLAVLPDGDETMVGVDGMNLSGGQRQRVVRTRKSEKLRVMMANLGKYIIHRLLRVLSTIAVRWWYLMIRSARLMERLEIRFLKTFLDRKGFSDS